MADFTTDFTPLPQQDAIDEAAIAWLVRLRDEASGAAEAAAFSAWLAADPRHARAWAAAQELWAGLDDVAPAVRREPPAEIVALARRRQPGLAPSRRAVLSGGLAASLALMVGGGAWLATARGAFADHRTGTGERREVGLPDGTAVMLGAASALALDFDPARRLATLAAGEAFVAVADDAARPFVLHTAHGSATATAAPGTAFEARIAGNAASFALASGEIAVRDPDGAEIRLAPGERVRIGAAGLGPIARTDPADIAAWRQGRILFRDAPLGEVIDDLQRYLPARIFMLDGALDDITVTGVFEASRAEAALQTIADTLPIRLVRVAGLLVLVTAG